MTVEIKPMLKKLTKEIGIAGGLGFIAWLFGANFSVVFFLTLLIRYQTRNERGNF